MKMDQNRLKKYIETLVEQVLNEADPLDDAGSADDASGFQDDSGIDLGGEDVPEGDDEFDVPTGDEEDGTGDEMGDLGDLGGDSSGGGGFDFGGGGFGAGGGGASGGDSGGDDSTSEGETTHGQLDTNVSMQDISNDPVQGIIDLAIDLSTKIGDSQQILNVVKKNIQDNFENIDDSVEVVEGLWNTENPKLRSVATKLLLFIRGG